MLDNYLCVCVYFLVFRVTNGLLGDPVVFPYFLCFLETFLEVFSFCVVSNDLILWASTCCVCPCDVHPELRVNAHC